MTSSRISHCPDPERWIARLLANQAEGPNGCILWTGRTDRHGYGRFRVTLDGRDRETGAHRAIWLAIRGDIPDSLVIDHLCRVRNCVNVDHMELVTISVNALRGEVGRPRRTPANGPIGTCTEHGAADGKWLTDKRGYTHWSCRICARRYQAAYHRRKRSA